MASLAHDWIAARSFRYNPTPSPSPSPNPMKGSSSKSSSSSSSRGIGVKIRSEQAPKAKLVARRRETVAVKQHQQRPLLEYMKLPASQYSVLDAERIERVDDNTFRCFVYRFSFFSFEVCPVLLLRVSPHPLGTSIHLLSCHLEGSPFVVAQNHKFQASMVNHISCHSDSDSGPLQHLSSDALIQVSIDIPFPFRAFPVHAIESSGTRVLEQLLALMLPRFMQQVCLLSILTALSSFFSICQHLLFSNSLTLLSSLASNAHIQIYDDSNITSPSQCQFTPPFHCFQAKIEYMICLESYSYECIQCFISDKANYCVDDISYYHQLPP